MKTNTVQFASLIIVIVALLGLIGLKKPLPVGMV